MEDAGHGDRILGVVGKEQDSQPEGLWEFYSQELVPLSMGLSGKPCDWDPEYFSVRDAWL